MKRLVYIIVFALWLTACYDDKGSYDYHDICEVNIEGLESVYETVYRESVLEIDLTVTVTEGNIGDTTSNAHPLPKPVFCHCSIGSDRWT